MNEIKEIKQLSGFLNTDDPNSSIGATHHKYAKNVRFRGKPNDMRPESIPGTTLIANNLPAGQNECIGRYYDELKQRVFYFNYNSSGTHGIYQLALSTNTISTVVVIGAGTDGDILGFTLNGTVTGVRMLYGDDTQGDALYFNNSQKQPCQINIKFALAGTYGTIKRSYIDVIKAPAKMPAAVVYENDATVSVNNLRKKLFRFRTRFIYLDKTKSIWSSESVMPLPVNYTDTTIDKDPTKNCRVAVVVPTGESDVSKIEIAAIIQPDSAVSGANEPIGYFTIKVVDKAAESVSSNDLYTYRFYNNQAYLPVDPLESIQLQDLVPLEANAMDFLNGNVPCYGGIKEGFNPNVITATTTSGSESQRTTQAPYIFVASQSGDSGFGTGNIHAIVLGSPGIGDVFIIYTTAQTVTFTCTVATTANVITGLSAAAVVAGFTVVSSDTENITIIKTAESLQRVLTTPVARAVTDSFVYDRNARYNYGVTYFDAAGRTIGALTNTTLPFQTINYTETATVPNIPKLSLSLSSRPPLHARYFQWARTKNLSKLTKLEWVCDRTFKDTTYAYVSIENLNRFIVDNPTSKHLAYDFSPGDRIRFMKRLSSGANTVYTTNDFEIQAQVLSPVINGEIQFGQILKIALPTTSGTFDFGSTDFNNYFIELYTPAQSVAEGLDKYFEFGERYTIGNPGTSTAYHQGMTQNQTSNLSQSALFEFDQGDFYYRSRIINTGGDLNYNIVAGERGAGRCTIGMDFVDRNFTDANILTGNSPLQSLAGFTLATNNDRWIIKIVTGTYTFRVKGTIQVDPNYPDIADLRLMDNTGATTYLIQPQLIGDTNQVFNFDVTVQLTTGQKLFIFYYSANDFTDSKYFSQTDIKITVEQPYTVGVIDPNFSDFFASAVNSNGRPLIVDENASEVYNPTLLRWGLAYEPNGNINQTNRFRELNFDEVDRAKGDIRVLNVREMILQIIQSRGACQKGIYGKFIQDSGGTNILTTTDDILTKNNANYYEGKYGIGNQSIAWCNSKSAFWFIDDVSGDHVRLDNQGMESVSAQNKGEFYIKDLLTPYTKDYLRANGSLAKIILYYDFFEDNCMVILQGGSYNGDAIDDYCFSFNEKRKAYCCFYDTVNGGFSPEMAVGVKGTVILWKNGNCYIQNDEGKNRTLFGVKFYPSITLVFNDKVNIKKTFEAISYQANNYWVADTNGDIVTSQPNEQTGLPQISSLIEQDFDINEGLYYAALNRDANSGVDAREALLSGDYLKGVFVEVKLTSKTSDFSYLYLPQLLWAISPKN